ncbi:serine protease AprX [Motilibacter rhizosphaerae]|uniref:Serine protease AprX n=1 Tax=Motilibacter rhizosphaerae TaxID=598652 RepID=A0A4Q7NVR4_9ACTN|nr:S8 family serine peptidase [Motilibacter rhizosphaerae]RZS91363.1 serine protease AprX [Motilibacter rhizosphaerae]
MTASPYSRTAALVGASAIAAMLVAAAPAAPAPSPGRWLGSASTAAGTGLSPAAVAARVDAPAAWRAGATGAGVDVAVVDTGIARVPGLDSPGQVLRGFDAAGGARGDAYGHGTVMAGLIAGRGGQAEGVAPGARLVDVRLSGRAGAVSATDIVRGIDWTVGHAHTGGRNIRVLNLSAGVPAGAPGAAAVQAAARRAVAAGIVVVAAAGNSGAGAPVDAPAADAAVIAVGATGSTGLLAATSTGDATRAPDLLAPGERILGLRSPGSALAAQHPQALIGTRWLRGSGTSHATAVVSGAVAVLLSARPDLTPDQVKALLVGTSSPVVAGVPVGQADVAAALAATAAPAGVRGSASTTIGDDAHTAGYGAGWRGSGWRGAGWRGAGWRGAGWRGAGWRGAGWRGAGWRGAGWRGAGWRGAGWRGAGWRGAGWRGAGWRGAGWRGAGWRGAGWRGAGWRGAGWRGAGWRGAGWRGAGWRGAGWR